MRAPENALIDVREVTVSHCCARTSDALDTNAEMATATVRDFTPHSLAITPEPLMNAPLAERLAQTNVPSSFTGLRVHGRLMVERDIP